MAFTHYVKAPGLQAAGCHSLESAERFAARHCRDNDFAIWTRAEFLAEERARRSLASKRRQPGDPKGFVIG